MDLDFLSPWAAKPSRCQRTRVSGFTKMSVSFHFFSNHMTVSHKMRSLSLMFGRFTLRL